MSQIFISYRRADSAKMSRRLYEALVKSVGKKNVFRDVDTLMKGHDFRAGIEKYVIQSDVMLVLIGDKWLNITDEETEDRRLDNPEDFVRIEVDMGLRHVQTVLPVLINGASMPSEDELPRRLSGLAFKNAIQLRDSHFDENFEELLNAIGIRSKRLPVATIAGAILAIVVIIAAIWGGMNLFGGTDTGGTRVAVAQTEEATPEATEMPEIPTEETISNELLADDDPYLGRADAPVVIVEFGAYACPYCGRFHRETLDSILEDYGQYVRYVFRDFPAINPKTSTPAALAANCAFEQGHVWEYHGTLYDNQDLLGDNFFEQVASDLGLNMTRFTRCFETQQYMDEINDDFGFATYIGVTGTPTFYINGKFISGAQPYNVFEAAIKIELAKVGIEY